MKYLGNLQNSSGVDVELINHTHSKSDLGLGNVDNTSDMDKPASTAVLALIGTSSGGSSASTLSASAPTSPNAGDMWYEIL